jgi:Mg2+ and Co2+ transporter CorA
MQATIFDGHTVTACSVEQAASASSATGLTWIDVKIDGAEDPQASAMFTALGIDPKSVPPFDKSGLAITFGSDSSGLSGVAWMDDQSGLPAEQLFFTWNANRLVTVRMAGDQAVATVQREIIERSAFLLSDPSAVLGVVLQMLLVGVQQGLVNLATQVTALDAQILATSNPNNSQSQQLTQLRRTLDPLALRLPAYEVNVTAALIDPQTIPGMSPGGVAQLQAFATQVDSTEKLITYITDSLRNAVQDLQGQVSGWQSNRINQLTIVTIIFLPITFMTGYFGMNFTWLDNQLNSMGAYIFWGVIVPIVIVLGSISILIRKGFTFTGLFSKIVRNGNKSSS